MLMLILAPNHDRGDVVEMDRGFALSRRDIQCLDIFGQS